MVRIFYRSHNNSNSFYRVWREDWPGDTFEIFTKTNLDILKELLAYLSIYLIEAED